MQNIILDLLDNSDSPLSRDIGGYGYLKKWGAIGSEIAEVLKIKNGFYAFDSAFLFRPLTNSNLPRGLLQWNEPNLWKRQFELDLSDILFFSEDVFGVQFCVLGDGIFRFDPETCLLERLASSLGEWLTVFLADINIQAGYSIASAWKRVHGSIADGKRLNPKLPFVLGGQFEMANLYEIDELKGMLFRASLSKQIRDLPDGEKIRINIK